MINEYNAHKFCRDDISKIENYDKAIADTTQTWHCHHRTEIWWNCTAKELIDNECYFNRKACELIFLTPAEHMKLHMKDKCLPEDTKQRISDKLKGIKRGPRSEEHRRKLSESHKGKVPWNKGKKGRALSEEHRRKISEANKGNPSPFKGKHLSKEHRRKISEAMKGMHWKMSESHKGKHWKLVDGKRVYYRN